MLRFPMFIIAAFVLGFFTMLLWNWLVPSLFHGPEVSYLQATGLLVLCRLLVGIRGPRRHWWHWKGKWGKHGWNKWTHDGCPPSNWADVAMKSMDVTAQKDRWSNWNNMSPEEKRKAKEEWCSAKEEWKSAFKKGWHKSDQSDQAKEENE